MSAKKKVLFVHDNLALGGVTKVLEDVLDVIDYSKFDVDLLILHYEDDMEVNINKNVNIIKGDAIYQYIDKNIVSIFREKNLVALLGKLWLVFLLKTGLIKTAIKKSRKRMLNKKYDTEVAFNDGFTEVFVANGDSDKKIAWFHIDISLYNDSDRYKKLIKESLRKMDLGVGVSNKAAKSYQDIYGIEKVCTIYNIIDSDSVKEKANQDIDINYDNSVTNLISVGRLCNAKNFERFVKAHKKLIDDGYKIHSYIVGDGPERVNLENLISSLSIKDSFTLLGRKENPYPYIKKSDLFVLSSLYEGFALVVYESLILGVPCISTDVADIEKHLNGRYGSVTENSDQGLYFGLKKILDSDIINEYRRNLKDFEFDTQTIIEQINEVL